MLYKKYMQYPVFIFAFALFSSVSFSQNRGFNYDAQWKKADSLREKKLTKSVIEVVNSIYLNAKKENNEQQIIKSLLWKNLFYKDVEEGALQKMIDTFGIEIASAKGIEKALLQSISAQLYRNYFDNNRYRLYGLTEIQGYKSDDIATWPAKDFQKKITGLYLAGLREESLKNISVASCKEIIEEGNVEMLRPTLYDLLAHLALDFFKEPESGFTSPAYAFEMNDPAAMTDAGQFVKTSFSGRDSLSPLLNALHIFQDLIRFHERDSLPLIDVDLERLEFVYQNGTFPGKDSLYESALKNIYSKWKNDESAEAGFLIGQLVYDKAKADADGKQMAESVRWLRDVSLRYSKSRAGTKALNLLAEIEAPSLSILSEKVNVPDKPFRTLVSFRNIDRIYLRVFKVNKRLLHGIDTAYTADRSFSEILALAPLISWEQSLPVTVDNMEHSVEIKTGPLPNGEYILLASGNKDFSLSNNVMSAQHLYISNISFIQNGSNYFVLNRTSGLPVSNATVSIWQETYNYRTRNYSKKIYRTLRTDKNGFFRVNGGDKVSGEITLKIKTNDDYLYLDDNQYLFSYNPFVNRDESYKNQEESDRKNERIFLFTDRAIYRPGQTVYFKGIGVTKNFKTGKPQLLKSNEKIRLVLLNGNYEPVDSADLALNDFGSLHGSFKLPQNQLAGLFRIAEKKYLRNMITFHVEEYKRPKFFADFSKPKENYKVNDTVDVTGQATAYSGNAIDGATVSYTVKRISRFLYPWYFWRRGLPVVTPREIMHGQTQTDENGNFKISFKAIPDNSLKPETDPVFDYQVSADITDINGETHSTAITIPAGYKSLDLQIDLVNKKTYPGDSLKSVLISSKNLSGEPQKTFVSLNIYKLKSPERFIRQRFWDEPDTTVMSKKEYLSLFPNDVYRNEDMPEVWPLENPVLEKKDSVNGLRYFRLTNLLDDGWYVAEITARDPSGLSVTDKRYFRVLDPHSGRLPDKNVLWMMSPENKFQPGDTAVVFTGVSGGVHLIQQTEKPEDSSSKDQFQFFDLSSRIRKFSYSITENDRGGFGIMQFFVKDNRFYFRKNVIDVPWNNKKLDISFDTYRDKTLPGSQETWKMTIRGEEGKKVSAEMLADMYDASLDQIIPHRWENMNIWPDYLPYSSWQANQNFTVGKPTKLEFEIDRKLVSEKNYSAIKYLPAYYDQFDRVFASTKRKITGAVPGVQFGAPEIVADNEVVSDTATFAVNELAELPPEDKNIKQRDSRPIRTNFNETAFFYPELRTDKNGNVSFSFTMPEALTTWRMMALAHTKDLSAGYAEKSVITQKDLMVVPNPPRFLREGDTMEFSAKVVNMSDKVISGTVQFHLLDASAMNPVDDKFENKMPGKSFTVDAKQSSVVFFEIQVPESFNDAVVYRITASAGDQSDGEEAFLPVVTNRSLITESLPLFMKGTGTKHFEFEKLLESGVSSTLTPFNLTVEYTANPAWYAVQALPYLFAYPYECTEQIFNRYFASALAMHIANSNPELKTVFEKWKTEDTAALQSNLEKNQDLKSVLLEETPWVVQAKNETQQKKEIAKLFDVKEMHQMLQSALRLVAGRQLPNGGFPWFKGGPDDRFITQYILSGIGHLKKLGGWPAKDSLSLESISRKAVQYLDNLITGDYERLMAKKIKTDTNQISPLQVYYLYARGFFGNIPIPVKTKKVYNYFFNQSEKFWANQNKYIQGMIALTIFRNGNAAVANEIVRSLRENSVVSVDQGMYWKEWNRRSFLWYQAPIESQSLMIEVFSEITKDTYAVDEMKTWLLRNKQTNRWNTTKATAEAVYALLLQGNDWLREDRDVKIELGKTILENKNREQEAGTGYFQKMIDGKDIKPGMGNISVTVSGENKNTESSPSWGAVYWQYFEDLDKITDANSPLGISKKLFVEKNTDDGPTLIPVNEGDTIHVGDKIKVRIIIKSDRDMEYVHMKDMRAACMEPVNVLSGYKWQGGLGYYEATGDVSTNFFFDRLPKGTYVFEYPVFVTHSGDFSNGIANIECMYAPEFSAHSGGVRVVVK